jgi:hypothetical protein
MIRRNFFAVLFSPIVGCLSILVPCRCMAVVVTVPPQEYTDRDRVSAQHGWVIKKCIGIKRCWLYRNLPTYQSESFPNG